MVITATAETGEGGSGGGGEGGVRQQKRSKILLKSVAKRDLPIPKYTRRPYSGKDGEKKKIKPSVLRRREEKFYMKQQGVIVSRARVKSYLKNWNDHTRLSAFAPVYEFLQFSAPPKVQQTRESIDTDTRYQNDIIHRLLQRSKLLSTNFVNGQTYTCTKEHIETAKGLILSK